MINDNVLTQSYSTVPNRVIVMDRGHITEMDSPSNLISQRGQFYRMCREAGLVWSCKRTTGDRINSSLVRDYENNGAEHLTKTPSETTWNFSSQYLPKGMSYLLNQEKHKAQDEEVLSVIAVLQEQVPTFSPVLQKRCASALSCWIFNWRLRC